MEVKLVDVKGKATSASMILADEVFGIEPNNHGY
jgi:hypothetical protein